MFCGLKLTAECLREEIKNLFKQLVEYMRHTRANDADLVPD